MKIVIKKSIIVVLVALSLQGTLGAEYGVNFKEVIAKLCTKRNAVKAGVGLLGLAACWKLYAYGKTESVSGIVGTASYASTDEKLIDMVPNKEERKVVAAAMGGVTGLVLNYLLPSETLATPLDKQLGYDSKPDTLDKNAKEKFVFCSHGHYASKEYLHKDALDKKYGKVAGLKDLDIKGLKNQFVGFNYPDAGDNAFKKVINLSRSRIGSEEEAEIALRHFIEYAKLTEAKIVLFGHSRGGSPFVHMVHMLLFPEKYDVQTWYDLGLAKEVVNEKDKKHKIYKPDTNKIAELFNKIDRVYLINPLLDFSSVKSLGAPGGVWNWFSKMFVTLATRTTLPKTTPFEKLTEIMNKKSDTLTDQFITVHFSEKDCMLGNAIDKNAQDLAKKSNGKLKVQINKDRGSNGHYWLRHGLEDLCGYLQGDKKQESGLNKKIKEKK